MKHFILFFFAAICLTTCSKEPIEVAGESSDSFSSSEITLTLRLPEFDGRVVANRAVDEDIKDLYIIAFDQKRNFLSKEEVDISQLIYDEVKQHYQLKIKLTTATHYVHIVANGAAMLADESANRDVATIYNTTSLWQESLSVEMLYWGYAEINSLLTNSAVITLIRQVAKTTITVEEGVKVAGFSLWGVKGVNSASKGSIAPIGWNYEANSPTIAADESYGATSESYTTSPIYMYETAAAKSRVVVKATYKGVVGYYPIAYYENGTNSEMPLLRNHHYQVIIKAVNATGYETEEEAIKGIPGNRLTVEIKDDNPTIYDMIACKDYELGVCDTVRVNWDATTATATVVTTLPDESYSYEECEEWITSVEEVSKMTLPVGGALSSPGVKYTFTIQLEPNALSEDSRRGEIKFKSGELSRIVYIHQMGKDFRRDDERIVMLYNLENVGEGRDYFAFLDNILQGVTPKEMSGVARNEGLHFSIANNSYYYQIPIKSGDQIQQSDSRFNVTQNGSFWEVRLVNNSSSNETWVSSFTLINSEGIVITYPIYRTGLFHQLDALYQVPSETRVGWFYYEQVSVTALSGNRYYLFDRNLGASSNGYYSPTTTELALNSGAVGAYLKISTSKEEGELSSQLSPLGYAIPEMELLLDLNITIETRKTASGETYNCATLYTDGSSLLKEIYFPISGYTEEESYKNSSHANVWSRSPVSGNQGFSEDSPEYKYWYMYLDIYGKKVVSSNMRFVNGGAGSNGGRYKGMPVRCIKE